MGIKRKAVEKALQLSVKYGPTIMGEGQTGTTVAAVLKNLLTTLDSAAAFSMEMFVDAAVRAGFNPAVGTAVYHIVDAILL
jgi:hypothetical protein